MRRRVDPKHLEADRQNGEPYQNLANAIVTQAAKDYVDYLREGYKRAYEARSIERFFRSQRFMIFTNIDPEWLISTLRDATKTERRPR